MCAFGCNVTPLRVLEVASEWLKTTSSCFVFSLVPFYIVPILPEYSFDFCAICYVLVVHNSKNACSTIACNLRIILANLFVTLKKSECTRYGYHVSSTVLHIVNLALFANILFLSVELFYNCCHMLLCVL